MPSSLDHPLTALRAALRVARVGFHLFAGTMTIAAVFPFVSLERQRSIKRRWSRRLLGALGIRLAVTGSPGSHMRVANHISWLDVFVINAVAPSAFVAKDDVLRWPLIGWMCRRTETLFLRRGSRRAARDIADRLALGLASGTGIVVFPEGTTSDGRDVLPFHGALLQAPTSMGVPVQPVAIGYSTPACQVADAPAYCDDTSLLQSIWRIAGADQLHAHIMFLPLVETNPGDRKALAWGLRDAIRRARAFDHRIRPAHRSEPAADIAMTRLEGYGPVARRP